MKKGLISCGGLSPPRRIASVALFILILLTLGGASVAGELTGRVISVIDGDTIEMLDTGAHLFRIRLSGIDAPEKSQQFGRRSKEHLSDLIFGELVEVDTGKIDKYGRTVGKVLVHGQDANLAQVRAGFAWHYKQYAGEQTASDRALYASAEEGARSLRIGLWRDPKPMAPWEWRHGGKDQPTTISLASGCPCNSETYCTGPKDGRFCVLPNGAKRYH